MKITSDHRTVDFPTVLSGAFGMSKSQARRTIADGGLHIHHADGTVEDWPHLTTSFGHVKDAAIRVGKRKWVQITLD